MTGCPCPDGTQDRLQFLADVSEAMISTLDTGRAADRLAELTVPRLADWATVTVVGEEGDPDQSGRAHLDADRLPDVDTYLRGRSRAARDEPVLAAALRSGEPVHLPAIDPALHADALPDQDVAAAWRRLQVTSCLFVPLRAHGSTFGALSLLRCGDRPPHTEQEITTAIEVARRGALALDNARLYSRQLKVAETLQRSLLTPPPQPPDLQIAVRYRPAHTHSLVGGDFYDAFATPDGATVLVIGDVTGHSVEATAAMSQLRSAVRTIAYDRPGSPAQILSRVDRVLIGLHHTALATTLVARIEGRGRADGRRTLRWSSAGHPPPALIRRDGRTSVLARTPERLLGIDPAAPRTTHRATLGPGDTLLLYTDGLVEAGRVDIDEGTARLARHLEELAGLPVDELCDRLLDRVADGRADDDIAVLAVRCASHV